MKTLTPIEYEQKCQSIFRLAGWEAKTTAVTGDQGADLVCQSGDTRVVVQCKLYSQPVGNSAVQQVLAARVYYGADLAAVVTNATFTKSAIDLAKKSFVHLLQDSDLQAWTKKFQNGGKLVISSTTEMMTALRLHGFNVKKSRAGVYTVKSNKETRFITGDGAFLMFAEQILKNNI